MMKTNRYCDKNLYLVILVIIIFFIVAVLISKSQFIWLDEGYTLTTIDASLKQVWFRAINFEGQPPLYFILIKIWTSIYNSIFFARLFSIIAVTISIYFAYLISEKHLKVINPVFVTLLYAFNPVVLWAALEIRVYALVLLFLIISIWLFLEIYSNTNYKPARYKRFIFSVLALLSVYTQYYLAFLFIGNFIFLIINKNWKSARIYLLDMALPALGVLFFIGYIPNQMGINANQNAPSMSLLGILQFMIKKVYTVLFPYLNYIHSGILKLTLFFVVSIIILFSTLSKLKYQLSKSNYFPVISLVLLFFFSGLLLITCKENIAQRHTISLIFPLIMTLVLIVSAIKSIKIKYTLLMLMIIGNSIVDFRNYAKIEQKGFQYKNVIQFINSKDKDDKPIFCFRYDPAIVLKHGLLKRKVYSIPNINFDSHFNRRKWLLKSTGQLDSIFMVTNIKNGFWLITSENDSIINKSIENRYGIHYDYKMLNDYISNNFYVEMEKQFPRGLTLRRVALRQKEDINK